MGKTNLTQSIEKSLWRATNKMGVFGCFEVTIGFGGNERVDYLTYDTKGIWRCYEIKTSKQDFYSNAAKTFIGHYNYFVMPEDLYEEVKKDIPKHIGVHNGSWVIKNPKKQDLEIDEQILKDSLIRSLHREQEKFIKTCDTGHLNRLESEIARLRRELRRIHNDCTKYSNAIYDICNKYDLDFKEVRRIVQNNKV